MKTVAFLCGFEESNRRIVQNPRSGVEVTLQEFLRALLFMQAQLLQTLQIGSGFLYKPVVNRTRFPTEVATNRV